MKKRNEWVRKALKRKKKEKDKGIVDLMMVMHQDSNAMKNHYLLTQAADIIMQIDQAWDPLRKEIKQSIKSTSSRLLESFCRQPITDEDVLYIQRYTTMYLE